MKGICLGDIGNDESIDCCHDGGDVLILRIPMSPIGSFEVGLLSTRLAVPPTSVPDENLDCSYDDLCPPPNPMHLVVDIDAVVFAIFEDPRPLAAALEDPKRPDVPFCSSTD
jgi:hypothetical protein